MLTDDLPVPADDTRQYVRITPTETPLDPETVTAQLQRLHTLETHADDGLLSNLLTNDPPPTVEIFLVATQEPTTVDYLVGIDPPDHHASLERILRGTFPDDYEFETIQWAPTLLETTRVPTAVEYQGTVERQRDWQTQLTPLEAFHTEAHARTPLATVVETMSAADGPTILQLLVRPRADWAARREAYQLDLEEGTSTVGDQLLTALVGAPDEEYVDDTIPPADQRRIDELAERNPRRSFTVNARALVYDHHDRAPLAEELATAFSEVSRTCYEIDGLVSTGDAAIDVEQRVLERTHEPADYNRLANKLPFRRSTSPGIVADARELGGLTLLDGSALPTEARRTLDTTPGERRAIPTPPPTQLETYRDDGLPLGVPLTQDHLPTTDPVTLPPELQPLHVGWFGKTGSGKSTSLVNAMLENHAATDGADILVDPKGDGMAREYMRAHYAEYGDLEDVVYFDCSETLPAFSVFDIRDEMDAGVARTTAVEDAVDHYIEMLRAIMGADRFEQAVRSPDIIRYLVKALFDPVNGSDAFPHEELHSTVRQMHERQSAPAVADEELERLLAGVVANSSRSFDEIMQGVANRIEKIPVDKRLATMFNHVPGDDDPHFDLAEYLDEDVVVIVDTGGLRNDAQRVVTLVVLSNLWTALRRRVQTAGDDSSYSLVNVYLEEAASVAMSGLLQELLAQSRSFGCSVTLAMQFPEQLRAVDEGVYRELLNNVSTYVTGNVPVDRRLAERLATADMSADQVGNHLRALERGEWLVRLPAPFDDPEPRPFQVESLPLPPGHPSGVGPTVDDATLDDEIQGVVERTREAAGLTLGAPSTTADDEAESTGSSVERIDSALPYTKRMPPTVAYDADLHALRCEGCENRYDTDIDGMRRAIACCSSLEKVDRDDVPVCSVQLKLTPDEREASEWSDRQLLFLQAVYNAQQLRFDPLEYDLLSDSMLRLQEYVGIDSEAVQDLQDAGLLRHDTDHPHRLYTVTPDGRSTIGEHYRRGIDYGHGQGDLEESSEHVLAVEVGCRYLEAEYVADPDSDVVEVVPYYEPTAEETATVPAAAAMGTTSDGIESAVTESEQRRLDIAGLDEQGEVVVAVEAERINNDVHRAVPDDYDKMAACDVAEAIWIVLTQSAGHEVLRALNDPPEGEPRVEKTYAETTPPQQFRLDTPGCTAIYPASWLQGQLEEES